MRRVIILLVAASVLLSTFAMPAFTAGKKHHPVKKDPKVCLVFVKFAKWDHKVVKGKKFFWISKSKAKHLVWTNGSWLAVKGEDDPDKWFQFVILKKLKAKSDCLKKNPKDKKFGFVLPKFVWWICHPDGDDVEAEARLIGPHFASAHFKFHDDDFLPIFFSKKGKPFCEDPRDDDDDGGPDDDDGGPDDDDDDGGPDDDDDDGGPDDDDDDGGSDTV